jgi:rhamnosyltransferase
VKSDLEGKKIMNENISAGIVLYNPDLPILKKNIEAIIGQVAHLCLIDNASDNIEEIEALLKNYSVDLIKNSKNEGIAKALNQICDYAISRKSLWALTLDQDSICENNLIDRYSSYCNLSDIGMITSHFYDRNEEKREENWLQEISYVDRCITSASLLNLKAYSAVGGFDESMFIDWVDYDISFAIQKFSWKILCLNYIGFTHEIGKKKFVHWLWFKFKIQEHSVFRKYYIFRNRIYIQRKYPQSDKKINIWKLYIKLILSGLFEKNPIKKLRAEFKGIKDGLKMPINYQWKKYD